MKIYTKGGDLGETGLYGGGRVSKDNLRIQAYGSLDELNAIMGLILAQQKNWMGKASRARESLRLVQSDLFQIGAELAAPPEKPLEMSLLKSSQIRALEIEIDLMQEELPPLKTFILPGGLSIAAWSHLARTVSRRVEREAIALHHEHPIRPVVLEYLNRISDYLFVLARYFNHLEQIGDIPWIAPQGGGE
jgi:cob(I)alamin adenosyltransferase